MHEPSSFSAETAASVTRARQHSVGDLLRRTALRFPDKLAVVDGDRRVSFAELDAAVNVEQVLARAKEHWAPYERPKYVVVADSLPKNPSGKILKGELREQHAGLATTKA